MEDKDELDTSSGGENDEESFAEMFAQSCADRSGRLEPGQKLTARILKVSSEWIFLDIGLKGEGIIDGKEFQDLDGQLTVKEGDTISAYFITSNRGEMRFTTKAGAGSSGTSQLEDAWQAGVPVEGVVEKEIKGGFEIRLGGAVRAFCPYSQISLRRVDNAESLIGTRMDFKISDYAGKGRNIVVSRRALLEEEQRRLKDETQAGLHEGMSVTGRVVSLQAFGAFVDIGGIEGLLPLSEIGWERVKSVGDVLHVGQQLNVVIKSIDRDKERLSLSLKDTRPDPWEKIAETYSEGSFHNGIVARLAPFGAFVTLAAGVDGLIHISRLGAGKRISHPREVVKEGEAVEVKVESIDMANRRLSLVLAGAVRAAEEEEANLAEFRRKSDEGSAGMGTLGDLLRSRPKKNKKGP